MGIKINILNVGNAGPLLGARSLCSTEAREGADGKTSRWAGSGIAGEGEGGEEIQAN